VNADATVPATAPRTASGTALLTALCGSVVLVAGLVAAYGWSPVTDSLIILEFLFVLYVAPRVSKRLLERSLPDLTAQHVAPALRFEVDRLSSTIDRSLMARLHEVAASVRSTLPPVPAIPSAQDVVAAVVAGLVAAQQEAREAAKGAPDPVEKLRVVFREELTAALEALDASEPSPVEGAQSMAQRSVEVRHENRMREQEFRAAVQQGGIAAVLAMDTLRRMNPEVYRQYAYQGAAGALELAKDQPALAKLGIKIPGGAAHDDGGSALL
jgi:hypothetical protein